MQKQSVFAAVVLGLILSLAGAPAHAQDSKYNAFVGYSFGTTSFSCSFGLFGCFDPALHGYAAGFTYNLNKNLGLEANFSGHNGNNSTILSESPTSSENGETEAAEEDLYTYTFGPKVSLPLGNFSLYTHFLVGAAHIHAGFSDACVPSSAGSCGTPNTPDTEILRGNAFAFKTGAGVDWNHGHWGIRILEVNYSHTSGEASGPCNDCNGGPTTTSLELGTNNFELNTGVTFNFGRMK